MKKTLFLIFSGAIVIFSIICICSGPVISGVIPKASDWKTNNCQKLTDELKILEDNNNAESLIIIKRKERNKCNRDKAMYGLEYSSLIIDVICGFVCTFLGLLHYFDIGKPFEKVTGIIGLATGIIGFVLTFVYVIYSGYIFTNDPYLDSGNNKIYKRDGDWAYAKKVDGKFECLYYKEGNTDSVFAKYSDLGKKQYNYNKKMKQESENTNSEFSLCHGNIGFCNSKYYTGSLTSFTGCNALYAAYIDDNIERKYLFDKWVTTIIFSCFILSCDIGLAIFGFLLFESNGSGI